MQRGTTKHNRLEANSSPIAEPSVKAVSLKRNKMKPPEGEWEVSDCCGAIVVMTDICSECREHAGSVRQTKELKFPYFVKISLNGEIMTEKVKDRKDEKRLKNLFPEMFDKDKSPKREKRGIK